MMTEQELNHLGALEALVILLKKENKELIIKNGKNESYILELEDKIKKLDKLKNKSLTSGEEKQYIQQIDSLKKKIESLQDRIIEIHRKDCY